MQLLCKSDSNAFKVGYSIHYIKKYLYFHISLPLTSLSSLSPFNKNYARVQLDNYESFDIVKEIVQFLKVYESLIGEGVANSTLAIQLFGALNELCLHNQDNMVNYLSKFSYCMIISLSNTFDLDSSTVGCNECPSD